MMMLEYIEVTGRGECHKEEKLCEGGVCGSGVQQVLVTKEEERVCVNEAAM